VLPLRTTAAALAAAVAVLAPGCSSASPSGSAGTAAPAATAAAPGAQGATRAPVLRPAPVAVLPHDPGAYTQGLVWWRGRLFESAGLYGRSDLREVQPRTGRVLRRRALPPRYFAEGLAAADTRLIQLTWREGTMFVWDRDTFRPRGRARYAGEGWGLATWGRRLLMSDGSSALRVLDARTLREVAPRIPVRDAGAPVGRLNELEVVHGLVWANLYPTDRIAVIDLRTGRVRATLDMSGLRRRLPAGSSAEALNGIAWDRAGDRVLVTGKWWPRMFALRVPPALRR